MFPQLTDYQKWLDLSWPHEPLEEEPFFDQIAEALHWPEPVFAAPGNPEDVLKALGVVPGDYVVLPNLSPTYWGAATKAVGADCLLVDAHPDTWQLDLDLLEEFLMNYTMLNERDELILKKDSRTIKTILVPHLLGGLCDLERLQFISRRFNLRFGEDISQALGSRWNGRPVGSFGVANYCSFAHNPILPFGQSVFFSTDTEVVNTFVNKSETTFPIDILANHLGRQLAAQLNDLLSAFQASERDHRQHWQADHLKWMALATACTGNGLSAAFWTDENPPENITFGRLTAPLYRQAPFSKCLYIRREDWSGKFYDKGLVLPARL